MYSLSVAVPSRAVGREQANTGTALDMLEVLSPKEAVKRCAFRGASEESAGEGREQPKETLF